MTVAPRAKIQYPQRNNNIGTMKISHGTTVTLLFILMLAAFPLAAQQPLLSPRDSTELIIGGRKLFIDYGKPSMRGRVIMGGLVPYNRWWRTGANEATSFRTESDLIIGGSPLPKGNYTLYTMPSESQWKLMINKQTGQWGTVYTSDLDILRLPLKKRILGKPVEKLSITLEKNGKGGGVLRIAWEKTELTLPFNLKKDEAGQQNAGIRSKK